LETFKDARLRVRSVGSVRRFRSSVCGLGQGSRFCPPAREGFCWKICSKKNLKLGSRVRAGWTWSGWLPFFPFFAMDYVRYTAPYGLWKTLDSSGHVSYRLKPDVAAAAADSMQAFNNSVEVGLSWADTKPAITRRPAALSPTNRPETKRYVIVARNRHLGRVHIRKQTERSRTLSGTCRLSVMVSDTTTSQGSSQENVTMPTCMAPDPGLALRTNPHHHHHHHLRISRTQERFMIWRALDTCP